mmetsp:Transcript_12249/g.16020  ORF Transcript_12249/g.16020 Transcript_12249/m.16020 type:complete len:440 (-) Transcript_12249:68-1387(-)
MTACHLTQTMRNFLLLLILVGSLIHSCQGSSGSPPFIRHHPSWVSASTSGTRVGSSNSHHEPSSPNPRPLNPRAQRYLDSRLASIKSSRDSKNTKGDRRRAANADLVFTNKSLRGGQDAGGAVVHVVTTVTNMLVAGGKLVLPPLVAFVQTLATLYRSLPKDAIVASTGIVYCFAGGYYPTLFSSMQAAQQYGWNVVVQSITDLTDEAIRVIDALDEAQTSASCGLVVKGGGGDSINEEVPFHRSLGETTSIVLATVDPLKINQASGALYTTWLGVSSVLEREYARVITLSLTMADYIETIAQFILGPPAYFCVAEKYHQWVPVAIGWLCKGAAMNVAWRLQRVMTAATSAVTGGLLFARAIARMLARRGFTLFGLIQEDDKKTPFDEAVGFMLAALGFYTQFEGQWRNGFSFEIPFPLSLVTWPFDWTERWIQWQITK